jgi:hypothetical protein
MPIYPRSLAPYLADAGENTGTIYLGIIDW